MKSHNMCFFDIRMDKNVNCDENNKCKLLKSAKSQIKSLKKYLQICAKI